MAIAGAVALMGATLGLTSWWVDEAMVLEAIGDVEAGSGLLAAAIFGTGQLLRTRRAWLLLPRGTPFPPVVPAVVVSFMANWLVALRAGIFVRPMLLAVHPGVPVGASTAGVLLERVLDLLALLLLVLLVVAMPGHAEAAVSLGRVRVFAGGVTVTLLTGLTAVGAVGPERILAWLSPVQRIPGGRVLVGMVASFAMALRELVRLPGRSIAAFGYTLLMWFCGWGGSAVVLGSMEGIGVDGWRTASFWAAVQGATAAVPTPLSLGVFEAAGGAMLASEGVSLQQGTAAALVVHVISIGMNTVLALIAAPWLALTWARARGARAGGVQ